MKKFYRFYGEEQDGFEEESNLKADESQKGELLRVLKEFERRRNQSRNGGGIMKNKNKRLSDLNAVNL